MEAAPLPLPLELQVSIWGLLDRTSVCTASLVCRSWHALSSDNHLWRELCQRELTDVEWTPRMLARRHKSWKHHFGVRLRAVDPIRAALHRVVPQLLDDARTRHRASSIAPTETVQISIELYYDTQRERRFALLGVLPHVIRHAVSKEKERMVVMVPTDTHGLVAEAAELGVACIDIDGIKAFKKDKKTIKKWERRLRCRFAAESMIRMIPRLMGPALGKAGKPFPILLSDDVPLAVVVEVQLRTFKAQLRRHPRLDFAVGNVELRAQQLFDNVAVVIDAVLYELPSRDRLKAVHLHATRGPSFTVFSAPPPPRPRPDQGGGQVQV